MATSRQRWNEARSEAEDCRRCPLYKLGTQTVFGEGPVPASIMLVGEQPGDQEDLAGHPFVGPAGQLLNSALLQAGIDRKTTYVTNAVKHFKNVPRGKRRIHQKPNAGEIDRCKWWLEMELELVRPKVLVALGATAARSIIGRPVRISALRGQVLEREPAGKLLVTVHPSMLLRMPDKRAKAKELERLVADLAKASKLI